MVYFILEGRDCWNDPTEVVAPCSVEGSCRTTGSRIGLGGPWLVCVANSEIDEVGKHI